MRKRSLAVLAATAAFAGVVAAAPTASAEPNPPGCGKGNFCIYSGANQTGRLLVKAAGNWSGSVSGHSVFNNGNRYPGADHISLTWTYNSRTWTDCFHYNPGPGKYKANFVDGVVFKKATWRGEC